MKKMTKFFALTIVLVSLAASSFAQVTATATATANIVTPLTLTNVEDMNFGNIYSSAAAGTITLAPNAAATRTPLLGATIAPGGAPSAAQFTVGGTATLTYSISLPASLTLSNGTDNIVVDTFTSNPATSGTIGAGGTQTLYIGATLNVIINQPAGVYTGAPFTVGVNYN